MNRIKQDVAQMTWSKMRALISVLSVVEETERKPRNKDMLVFCPRITRIDTNDMQMSLPQRSLSFRAMKCQTHDILSIMFILSKSTANGRQSVRICVHLWPRMDRIKLSHRCTRMDTDFSMEFGQEGAEKTEITNILSDTDPVTRRTLNRWRIPV